MVSVLTMPLQNRVTPFGDIVTVAARGVLMGNRGRLHDATRQIVRRQVSSYRTWVTCLRASNGRRGTVMTGPPRPRDVGFSTAASGS